jgi:RimJ/RimL family protein N-acetyltransferase
VKALIPEIATERLRLRGHLTCDLDASAAMWGSPEVTRFISGRPSSREESWRRLLHYAGHWTLMGFGYWLIEERVGGRFVGEGGFADFQRNLGAEFDSPEHGWALAPWAQGQGYALEATQAMIAWGETHFRRSDFFCIIAPVNAPSLKLAAKLGYAERTRTLYHGEPTVILRRL